jgi:hypothetical protein
VHKREREELDICIIDNLFTVSFARKEKKVRNEGRGKRKQNKNQSRDQKRMEGIREGKTEEAINIHILKSAKENNSDCTHCITFLHYCAAFSRSSQL